MTDPPTADDFPNDEWHNYVYMVLSVSCEHCGIEPDLECISEGLPEGDEGARIFTIRTVAHVKRHGWKMHDRGPICPACADRGIPETSN